MTADASLPGRVDDLAFAQNVRLTYVAFLQPKQHVPLTAFSAVRLHLATYKKVNSIMSMSAHLAHIRILTLCVSSVFAKA